MEYEGFEINDIVKKKSRKPFKKADGSGALNFDIIKGFEINEQDPKKRKAALLYVSNTLVNLDQLEVISR